MNTSNANGVNPSYGVYDPFARGPYPVGVRTLEARDAVRDREFRCELWYPPAARHAGQDLSPATQDTFADTTGGAPRRQAAVRDAEPGPGTWPLIVFSHNSGGGRRQSTFLTTHLASHGYVVSALDHSEQFAPELVRREGDSAAERAARVQAWIANRVPDVRFLLDELLSGTARDSGAQLDAERVGIVGHSFGGWTALATPESDSRIRAVVALTPGGSSNPPPNIIPATLTFAWGRDVPVLYLVAEDDSFLPLAGMFELYERTRATKQMVILRRADHMHFADEFEQRPGQSDREHAHLMVRGLTLAHLDATLKGKQAARQFLAADVAAELARRGVEAYVH